jgi:hypothetical protein
MNMKKGNLLPQEVEKRLRQWADITQLSLDLKRSVLKKKYPGLDEKGISELIRKELDRVKIG